MCTKKVEVNQNKTKAILETKPPSTKKEFQSLLGKINFLRRFISNLNGKTQVFSPLLRLKKEDSFNWVQEHQKAFDAIKDYLTMPPIRNKSLKLYISASDWTIGSMLAQEDENGVERVIYYLSIVLNDAETRHSPVENCVYVCIFHAVLIPYQLQGHINPMYILAKLIHLRAFHIIFVNTEYNHKH